MAYSALHSASEERLCPLIYHLNFNGWFYRPALPIMLDLDLNAYLTKARHIQYPRADGWLLRLQCADTFTTAIGKIRQQH